MTPPTCTRCGRPPHCYPELNLAWITNTTPDGDHTETVCPSCSTLEETAEAYRNTRARHTRDAFGIPRLPGAS